MFLQLRLMSQQSRTTNEQTLLAQLSAIPSDSKCSGIVVTNAKAAWVLSSCMVLSLTSFELGTSQWTRQGQNGLFSMSQEQCLKEHSTAIALSELLQPFPPQMRDDASSKINTASQLVQGIGYSCMISYSTSITARNTFLA